MADNDGSTRVDSTNGDQGGRTSAPRTSGTAAGADVTSHMTGNTGRDQFLVDKKHNTSVAAVFALAFGLSALFCALTAILSPAAVVFGIIGIVLGVLGLKMAKRPWVHGRGVAIGGLVTAVLGLLLGAAVLAGATILVNNDQALNRIQTQLDKLRDTAPSSGEIVNQIPGQG